MLRAISDAGGVASLPSQRSVAGSGFIPATTYQHPIGGGPLADKQDAQLLVQLHEQWTTTGVDVAAAWIAEHQPLEWEAFSATHSEGSEAYGLVVRYMRYYETLGTLWKNRLFDEALLFDWLWLYGAWDRISSVALGMREKYGVAGRMANFQVTA